MKVKFYVNCFGNVSNDDKQSKSQDFILFLSNNLFQKNGSFFIFAKTYCNPKKEI